MLSAELARGRGADVDEDLLEVLAAIADDQRTAIATLQGDIQSLREAGHSADPRAIESDIHALEAARDRADALAETRLRIIEEQRQAIKRFRRWRLLERMRTVFEPRLGVLYQYPPRPIHIPDRYHQRSRIPSRLTLSIVTPSRNQGAFIERTIESVISQNYSQLEYIVQDGASTDDTVSIVNRYASALRHFESTPDSGFGNGINRAFRHATGEIMAYLNSDDLLLAGAVDYVMAYFQAHPEVDVVYGHRAIIDEYDAEIGRWVLPRHEDEILSWADYVPQETLFWRRSIWDKAGGAIDESFRFAIDWDLLLRFRSAGAHMVRLPRFLGAFRVHPHQKTSSEMEILGLQEMNRLRERCHARAVTAPEVHRAIRPYLRRHIAYQKLYGLGLLRY